MEPDADVSPRAVGPGRLVPLDAPSPPLPTRAAVVVIGGGIMGVSIAHHLAEAGVDDVLVVERDTLGSGSSAKPVGGVRATFSDVTNILLGQRSLDAFESFPERFGRSIGLQQVGYLFLCRTPEELDAVSAAVELQNSLGCASRMIDPAAAYELNPFLDPDQLLGASFSPRDGFAEPALVIAGYADAARRHGVRFAEHTEVIEIGPAAGGRHRIGTHRGAVVTDTVILAAGAWSTALGAMLGVHLPIEPVRRQIGLTAQQTDPPPTVPFTLDLSTTLYFHNHGRGLLLGISDPAEPAGTCREFSHGWTRAFDAAASVVAPSLAHRSLVAGWAGLYENTPDHNAMIGRAETPGVLYATGFSGHGFLQGPAVGEVVADLYLGREPFLDPSPLSAERFAGRRSLVHEVHII